MKRKDISFTWEVARYFDLWSIVHLLSGAVLGLVFSIFEIEKIFAYLITFVLLVLWEAFEYFYKLFEPRENRVLDVVIGIVGFSLTFSLIGGAGVYFDTKFALLVFSLIILSVLALLGWLEHARKLKK